MMILLDWFGTYKYDEPFRTMKFESEITIGSRGVSGPQRIRRTAFSYISSLATAKADSRRDELFKSFTPCESSVNS